MKCISVTPLQNNPWSSSHISGYLTSLVSSYHSLPGPANMVCAHCAFCPSGLECLSHILCLEIFLPLSLPLGSLFHEASLHCCLISTFPMLHSCSSDCTVNNSLVLKGRNQTDSALLGTQNMAGAQSIEFSLIAVKLYYFPIQVSSTLEPCFQRNPAQSLLWLFDSVSSVIF